MNRRTVLGLIGASGALWGTCGSAARGQREQEVEGAKGPRFFELKGHRFPVLAAGFDRAGARIATGSLDRTLTIWDAATGLDRPILFHDFPVHAVAFSPDGKRVASGAPERAFVAPPSKVEMVVGAVEPGRPQPPVFFINPRRQKLDSYHEGGVIRVWDIEACRPVVTWGGMGASPKALAFSRDGRTLACLDHRLVLTLHDAGNGREIARMAEHRAGDEPGLSAVSKEGFSADARRVVSISHVIRGKNSWGGDVFRTVILLWDAAARRVRTIEHSSGAVAISPDGGRVAAGNVGDRGDGLTFFDFETGAVLRTAAFAGRGDPNVAGPIFLAFSPDGSRLAVSHARGPLAIHDGVTGERLQWVERPRPDQGEVRAVAFSDGWLHVVEGGVDFSDEWDRERSFKKLGPLVTWRSPLERR